MPVDNRFLSCRVRGGPRVGSVVGLVAACLLFLTAVLSGSAHADVSGLARVIDGDTIEVSGSRIRLHGIDAPESEQLCCVGGTARKCGRQATRALRDRIGGGLVDCEERDRDRYGRLVALCRVGGGDLGAWLVIQGWALAYRQYSDAYVSEEASARESRRGLWHGEFVAPWDWRAGERLLSTCQVRPRKEDRTPGNCLIKGNIARDGERIYHLPGGQYYDRTRIDSSRGERWFCTEAEAREAGWRRSRR